MSTPLPPTLTRPQLLSFAPFTTWLSTLSHSLSLQSHATHPFHANPYTLRSLTIQSADHFGARLGFVKLSAHISNAANETLPGIVFLRGGSVTVLVILDDGDEEWVLLTVQPRIAVGCLEFVELPAGMVDGGEFVGAAAKELWEECGIVVAQEALLDLAALAVGAWVEKGKERVEMGVYPSPGGEFFFFFFFFSLPPPPSPPPTTGFGVCYGSRG